MSTGLEATEKECAAVAVAPRVTLADIQAQIEAQFFMTADEAFLGNAAFNHAGHPGVIKHKQALRLMTLCCLVMRNGFTIIGKSAPASAENFNADLGRKLAYEDAVRQLWPLMGYALKDKLAFGGGQ